MNTRTTRQPWIRRATTHLARVTLGVATFTLGIIGTASAQVPTPPPVPPGLEITDGSQPFLLGRGVGTQNYECQPTTGALGQVSWVLFTPQATLFDDLKGQLTSHFFSPNPAEGQIVRATWRDSADSSTVWARATAQAIVDPTAITWVTLQVVGTEAGPTGGTTLTAATFVQRLNTKGGLPPATGCSSLPDVGHRAFMPYTADYFFFRK
jgi:hypothetical protein